MENTRELVYDRNETKSKRIPSDEIKITGFSSKKTMKPFLYPNFIKKNNLNNQKSGRYVEMIKNVIERIQELKTNNKAGR